MSGYYSTKSVHKKINTSKITKSNSVPQNHDRETDLLAPLRY